MFRTISLLIFALVIAGCAGGPGPAPVPDPAEAPVATSPAPPPKIAIDSLDDLPTHTYPLSGTVTELLNDPVALEALEDLSDMPLDRYPHYPFLERIWQLRENVTAYDAAYIALAEALDVTLVTRDRSLARAPGIKATVELL